MSEGLSANYELLDEMHDLVVASLTGKMTSEEAARLHALVSQGVETYDLYLNLIAESSILLTWAASGEEELLPPASRAVAIKVDGHPANGLPAPVFSSVSNDQGTGRLFADWSLAYLVATVVLAFGLTIAALTHISSSDVVTLHSPTPQVPSGTSILTSNMEIAGQITGMVDCVLDGEAVRGRHASRQPLAIGQAIALGDRFAIRSGLVEIAYDTGAKVILQGPVVYEVESMTGGHLAVGRLTARLEKKGIAGSRSTVRTPLFAITTPSAVVTDLGTEFGLEVNQQGQTKSHVFRGSVRVQSVDNAGKPENGGRVLREGESVQVNILNGRGSVITVASAAEPIHFVRSVPKQTIKTLDLVDVVAGGNGFTGRRNRGIDPTSGRAVASNTRPDLTGDGQYHRVQAIPFVDGVFIPRGGAASVQLDSAGHTFAEFDNANNLAASHVWAGGEIPTIPRNTIPTKIGGIDYGTPDHGFLYLHANKGITFSLDAIRRANPGWKIARFYAVAGNAENVSATGQPVHAEFWVFVDGQLQFRRRDVSSFSGAMPINIPIADKQAFLTLVATDGGHPIGYNWILFGDPRLELKPTVSAAAKP